MIDYTGVYPPGGDNFHGFIDQFRCQSVDGGRRCQLYDSHDGAHAHAVLDTKRRPTDRPHHYPFHPTYHRWSGDESWVDPEAPTKMRWACMFRT